MDYRESIREDSILSHRFAWAIGSIPWLKWKNAASLAWHCGFSCLQIDSTSRFVCPRRYASPNPLGLRFVLLVAGAVSAPHPRPVALEYPPNLLASLARAESRRDARST